MQPPLAMVGQISLRSPVSCRQAWTTVFGASVLATFGASVLATMTRSRETGTVRKFVGSHSPSYEPSPGAKRSLRRATGRRRLIPPEMAAKPSPPRSKHGWSVAPIMACAPDALVC